MSVKTTALVAILLATLATVVPGVASAEPWRDPAYKGMWNQLSIKNGEQPRNLPKDSVPVTGKQVKISRFDPAIDMLANPVSQPTAKSMEHGKFLFETYCFPCHGKSGMGDGPLLTKGMPGPNLLMDMYKQKSDGFLWATALQGTGALMPGYADSMSSHEAWELVNYIRSLQKQ